MRCPQCGAGRQSLSVKDKRNRTDGSVRRRRECGMCGYRFTTAESVHIEETTAQMVPHQHRRRSPCCEDEARRYLAERQTV